MGEKTFANEAVSFMVGVKGVKAAAVPGITGLLCLCEFVGPK